MDGDVLKAHGHRVDARVGGILARGSGVGEGDGRGVLERVDGQTAHLGPALSRAHDDDVPDMARAVERTDRPGHHGAARDVHELLAAGVSETLTAAAGHDHGADPAAHEFSCLLPCIR